MKKLPRQARSRSRRPDQVSTLEDKRQPRLSRELSVLYEDDAVVVLDKPAGLLAVPIKGSDTPSALSLLIARLKLKRQRVLVVHRIDRFASGHSYLQRPARIEMRWCGSFSTTPPSGGTSRHCAAVSALRQGPSFTTFDVKECINSCARRETPGRLVPNFDIPSNALLRMLRSSGLSWSQDCRIRSGHNLRRSATRLSATENITGQNRRNS